MKILFPIGLFHPASVGGPSNTVYWHTCFLTRNNVETYVVTTDFKIDASKHNIVLDKWLKTDVGNIIYCKTKFQFFPVKALAQTIKYIFKVDIVHYSSAYYYLTIYTILLSILLGKRVILSPRGEFFENAINSWKKRIVIKLYRLFQNKIEFHATSEVEQKIIISKFPKANIFVQPNLVQIDTSVKNEIKSRNIVFLGILNPVKKIENILDAICLTRYFDSQNCSLLIAGAPLTHRDVLYKIYLEKKIEKLNLKDKVFFVGELFGKQKEDFLNNAYVLILPSTSENFGNVVVEALSQSTPVIASKGTPWSLLNTSNSGWWVSNSPEILAGTIDDALSLSPNLYLEKCSNSLKVFNQNFNILLNHNNNKWLLYYGYNNSILESN